MMKTAVSAGVVAAMGLSVATIAEVDDDVTNSEPVAVVEVDAPTELVQSSAIDDLADFRDGHGSSHGDRRGDHR